MSLNTGLPLICRSSEVPLKREVGTHDEAYVLTISK